MANDGRCDGAVRAPSDFDLMEVSDDPEVVQQRLPQRLLARASRPDQSGINIPK
jgi:hypothetical protein